MDDLEEAFERWKDVLELQSKYITALGSYKKDHALGVLRQAVAAGEFRKARQAEAVVQQIEAAMHRLRHYQRKMARRIATIERKAADAAMIRRGEHLPANLLGRMWAGFAFFQRQCPQDVVAKLCRTALTKDARTGENFCHNRYPDRSCADVPSDVTTVDGLMAWLQSRHYMPRRGTPAYAQVTEAFAQVAAASQQQVKSLEESLAALEKGAVQTWKPMMLALMLDDDVAKPILKAAFDDD
jgi:methyl-accepting chemotaxis protein